MAIPPKMVMIKISASFPHGMDAPVLGGVTSDVTSVGLGGLKPPNEVEAPLNRIESMMFAAINFLFYSVLVRLDSHDF